MILFHAKRDGTVTTTPDLVPRGSSMQDLVVVSEFDYAYCAIKLLPASGEYIEDIPCTPILQKDYSTIFTAALPPKATVVAGSVDYQLIFTAADGTTQTTLAGSFTVPRGVPVSTPGSVEELSVKTVGDLYAILSSLYVAYVGHEKDIYQSLTDITALKKTVSSAGYVTIPVTQWNDGTPTIAEFTLDGFGAGMTAMLIPADSNTQTAAREARLSAYPVAFPVDSDTQTVEIIRADAGKAPEIPLRFAYLILKTADTSVAPTVAILGVDAYGEGGGAACGVDESAVKAIITAMLGNVDNVQQYSAKNPPPYPVTKVNGQTGEVNLPIPSEAADVKADPVGTAETKTAALRDEVNGKLADYDKSTAVNKKIGDHNVSAVSHEDIRLDLQRLADRLNAALNSEDTSLDDLKEIVAYIKSNKTLIDGITSSKVNVTDIVNNLTTNTSNVPLSAAQGVVLKLLIDNLEEIVEGKTTTEQVADAITNALKDYITAGKAAELYQPKEKGKGLSANDYTDADKAAVSKAESDSAAAVATANKAEKTAESVERRANNGEFDGQDGYTPVPGIDYPTDAQIDAKIAAALAERNQLKPLLAESVEWLEENGEQEKLYVLTDKTDPNCGYIYAYLTKKVVNEGGEPLFTNEIDSADKNINQRWSYSGKKLSAEDGYMTTDLIPVRADQKVYVNLNKFAFNANYSRIHYFTSAGTTYVNGQLDYIAYNNKIITVEDGVASWDVGYHMTTSGDQSTNTRMESADTIAYMRLVLAVWNAKENTGATPGEITQDDVSNLIVSVGNPIKYTEPSITTETRWTNTGLAFVPADYEGRIIDLEEATDKHTMQIAALEKAVESGVTDETETDALERIKTWDKPVYDDAPVTLISDDRVKPALTTIDRTVEAIYAKYRALRDDPDHPENALYITETNMGPCTASDTFAAVDMLRFDFKEPDGLADPNNNSAHLHETKPKIIMMSGVHTEWAGVWGLYYALEEIATNPEFDDIRRNAHIIVVPCANPFCLSSQTVDGWTTSHVNANGVAIHNNFGVNHSTKGSVGEYNYGGATPYSELETQYIDQIMADNTDAVAFVSCHNYDYSTTFGAPVIWASSATYYMCNLVYRLVDKMSKAWIAKYGNTLIEAIDTYKINMDERDYRLGRASMSASAGTEQKNATKYGIQATNLEIARIMKVFSGNTDGTSEVMTHGAEVYANFIRTVLRAYDYNDKRDYAPNLPWNE